MSLSPSLQNGRISLAFSEFGELLNSTNSFLFINHNLLGTEVSPRRLRCFYWKFSRKEILSAHNLLTSWLFGCLHGGRLLGCLLSSSWLWSSRRYLSVPFPETFERNIWDQHRSNPLALWIPLNASSIFENWIFHTSFRLPCIVFSRIIALLLFWIQK